MKFFPVKVAIICLLVTPALYLITLTSYENYLDDVYTSKVSNILIGDSKDVLEGTVQIEERIADNILLFKKTDFIINRLRADVDILVTTEPGKVIYPIFLDNDSFSEDLNKGFNQQEIAKHNFDVLNEKLKVNIEIRLGYGSRVSLLIMAVYSFVSLLIFSFFYRSGSIKADKEREQAMNLINQLQSKEKTQQERLDQLKHERQDLFKDIEKLNSKYLDNKAKAKENEEDLFDEIISLENKLNAFIELKQSKDQEIDELKSRIQKYERRKGSKTKRVDYDFISKRFSALYKKVSMHRKALSGFLNLNDDQQIKAEEIILLLDRSPDKVTIKRKVFSGKKHKHASFEVLFAYNGRLYFDKDENNKFQILVIGTKKTQQKDMEFLHSL